VRPDSRAGGFADLVLELNFFSMKTEFQLGLLVGLLLICSTLNAQVDSLRYSFTVKNDTIEYVIVNDHQSSVTFEYIIIQDEHVYLAEGEEFVDALDSVIVAAPINTSVPLLFALELYEVGERSFSFPTQAALSALRVAPNPATDHLSLELFEMAGKVGTILLADQWGRIVYQQTQPLPNTLYLDAQVRTLSPGTYSLTVFTANRRETVKFQK